MKHALVLTIHPIILANIFLQSPGSKHFLLVAEPGCSSGKIWNNKEGDQCNKNLKQLASPFVNWPK